MTGQQHTWILRGGRVFTPAPFGIMGIVNVTPDSFYDGGMYTTPQAALDHAGSLLAAGAHILDIGAESTRPGAQPVAPEEEMRRLMPVLQAVRTQYPDALVAIDTRNAATAHACLEAGAHIINDVSACMHDPALLEVLYTHTPGYVLMHSQGTPENMQARPHYTHVVDEIRAFFEHHLQRLTRAGLPEAHIVLDPGIGFGKSLEHTMDILQNIHRIVALGRPVLMGLSMKSFLGALLSLPSDTEKRALATHVATALLAARGVVLHRVHNVAATTQILALAAALAG